MTAVAPARIAASNGMRLTSPDVATSSWAKVDVSVLAVTLPSPGKCLAVAPTPARRRAAVTIATRAAVGPAVEPYSRPSAPIGALGREYGSTAGPTAARVAIVTAALRRAGVGATAKHFPGLGRVTANTDTSTLAQDDVATASDVNLMPFAAAIRAGATAVMVSSARYPLLDSTNPAVWSAPIITTLLRGRLGFTGLVISDDISNAVAVSAVLPGDRAIRFLQAGGDMVLIVNRADLLPMLSAVQSQAAESPAFAAILRQAAQHVVESKIKLGLVPCSR